MRGTATTWVVAAALLFAGGSACAAPPASGGGEAARTVRGEVTAVDEARGMVTVRVSPAAVKGLKKGDPVTVRRAGEHAGGAERKPAKAPAAEETKAAAMPKGR